MLNDIKRTLWAAADKLRANMNAAEYKHLVLGLIFVQYTLRNTLLPSLISGQLRSPDAEKIVEDVL
jgi:hypothetical protein